jgi:hypothetical protein
MPPVVPDRVLSAYWRAAPAFHLLGVSALLLPLMGGACGEPEGATASAAAAPLAVTSEPAVDGDTPPPPPASTAGCDFEGKHHEFGDTFYDELRCNRCDCSAEWGVVCTARACSRERACTLGDRQFADSTIITCEDGCNICRCMDKGWNRTLAFCGPLQKVEKCDDAAQGVVKVDVLYRSDDALALELGTGGCQGDTPPVKLCWDGAIAESAPVQMRLRAVPTAITSCSGWVTQQKIFDLSPLRAAFEAAYPDQPGDIRVLLGSDEIRYAF